MTASGGSQLWPIPSLRYAGKALHGGCLSTCPRRPLRAGGMIRLAWEVLLPFSRREITPGTLAYAGNPVLQIQVPQDRGTVGAAGGKRFAVVTECHPEYVARVPGQWLADR